ncbi:MAG: Mut7-C RNAse domain-containing protein [Nitrososphaerales archaeon]
MIDQEKEQNSKYEFLKFIADGMLGSLARKLRIYGFDVLYNAEILDENILAIAKNDNRIILTSDRALHEKAILNNLKSVLLSEDNDEDRMVNIFKRVGVRPELNPINSRCPLCNGNIEEVDKDNVKNIPESVLKKHDHFYSCVVCGKIYWVGSHWLRLKKFSEKIIQRLRQA